MRTPDSPARPTMAEFEALSIEQLFARGSFYPASVQRSFVWTEVETNRLLIDIEKLLQRIADDTEPSTPAAQEIVDASADSEMTVAANDEEEVSGDALTAPDDGITLDPAVAAAPPAAKEDAPVTSYFVGNMILRRSKPGEFEIFDGLQRFTVLTVLLAVLRDLSADADEKARLHRLIVLDADAGFRLRHFGQDGTLATHIQPMGSTPLKTDRRAGYEIGRRILAVKMAIEKKLAGWSSDRRSRFADLLLRDVWAGAMHVTDARVARQMFVSTNQHGKRLELTDVLKGQLFDLASRVDGGAYASVFAAQWTELLEKTGDQFPEALKAFDAIERARPQDATWPTDLGEFAEQAYPGDEFRKFAMRLRAYTHRWRDCRRILATAGRERVERDLWRLHVFRWTEWHGLALAWWQELHDERARGRLPEARMRHYISRFDRLHRRCMAITLARCDEPVRQRIFARALDQHRRGIDVFANALDPTDRQRRTIDRTLQTEIHDREIWAPLIRWIEIAEWRPGLPDLIRLTNTEHVRPRRPEWEDALSDNMRRYNEGCFSLGNLAVISKAANDKLTNDEFVEKLPTLRLEAAKFRTMHDVVYDEAGNERTEWTNEIILKRAEALRQKTWALLRLKPPQSAVSGGA